LLLSSLQITIRPCLSAALRQIRHVVLDMDGTIYSGGTLFKQTLPFLQLLKQLGIGYTFLTNNSSKSTREYVAYLGSLGIPATPEAVYTSTKATIQYLLTEFPQLRRLFVLGTPSLAQEFSEAGFMLTKDDAEDEPEAVIVGFDTTLCFSRLCRAAYWIKKEKLFIATHPDRICPTDQPTVLVDCGSICAALERATGRAPEAVLGKPDPRMLECILRRERLQADQLVMVGDRLYTDILMARQTGVMAVLVLTGETTGTDVAGAQTKPDLVVMNLDELGEKLKRAETPEPMGVRS